MEKAIWFSRHEISAEQVEELRARGYELVAMEQGMKLGAMSLDDDGDVYVVGMALLGLCAEHGAKLIAGNTPAPLRESLWRTANRAVIQGEWEEDAVACMEAWNVRRSVDGGKPTFDHKRFVQVGVLDSYSLRWSRL